METVSKLHIISEFIYRTFFLSSSCSRFDNDFLPIFMVPTSNAFSLLSDIV